MIQLYFSNELNIKSSDIRLLPLTIIEAPAGYGKTTYVKHVLTEININNIFWYTAIEKQQDYSYMWFINKIKEIDENAYKLLLKYKYLNRNNAIFIADIISNITTSKECYIVFDNFQFIVEEWQPEILSALANRVPDGLHVIIITQFLGKLRSVVDKCASICSINLWDLLLSSEDIKNYSDKLQLSSNTFNLNAVYQSTSGWPVAVSLYFQNLKRNKENLLSFNTDLLLYELFYKNISKKRKKFLLRLCPFQYFNKDLIDEFLKKDFKTSCIELADTVNFLKSIPLVEYADSSSQYFPHIILLNFLRKQLDTSEETFRFEVYRNAGDWYKAHSQVKEALVCYTHVKDYAGILSTNLKGMLMETFDGVTHANLVEDIHTNCSDELLMKYPISSLRVCYALYSCARFTEYEEMISHIEKIILKIDDPQIIGEWWLVKAFYYFPDLRKMKECYLKAAEFMYHPSQIFDCNEPFMFGCTSMWYLFYSKPGEMMQTCKVLEETMDIYNRLTNNHGKGAFELYKGEALCVQGEYEETEIWAYKAALFADSSKNITVTYGVALLLGINSIYKGDITGLKKAIVYLEEKSKTFDFYQGKAINRCMVDTVRAYLLGLLMEPGRTPKWSQGDADCLNNLTFTNFMVKTTRITDLILQKKYSLAIASVEASLQLDKRLISLSTQNFMHIGLALCYLAIGKLTKAAEHIDISLSIAKQDHNYTFLASFRRYLSVLFVLPSIAVKHGRAIQEIRSIKINYSRPDETGIFSMLQPEEDDMNTLTTRELEVAKLAARGLRNKEIADKLHISEDTVKTHLKVIFQKINIDRRSKLRQYFD